MRPKPYAQIYNITMPIATPTSESNATSQALTSPLAHPPTTLSAPDPDAVGDTPLPVGLPPFPFRISLALAAAAASALADARDALAAAADAAMTLLVLAANTAVAGLKPDFAARQAVGSSNVVAKTVNAVSSGGGVAKAALASKFAATTRLTATEGSMRTRGPMLARMSLMVLAERLLLRYVAGRVLLVVLRGLQAASVFDVVEMVAERAGRSMKSETSVVSSPTDF